MFSVMLTEQYRRACVVLLTDLQKEEYAKTHLLASGIVDELKKSKVYIWTVRASAKGLFIAFDTAQNKNADSASIQRIIKEFLSPLDCLVEVKDVPIAGNCCYGVCHGCLNGDPETQKMWLL